MCTYRIFSTQGRIGQPPHHSILAIVAVGCCCMHRALLQLAGEGEACKTNIAKGWWGKTRGGDRAVVVDVVRMEQMIRLCLPDVSLPLCGSLYSADLASALLLSGANLTYRKSSLTASFWPSTVLWFNWLITFYCGI